MFRTCYFFIVASLFAPAAFVSAQETSDVITPSFADLDGLRVHYQRTGRGKTTLVFIHGWTCDSTFWKPQVAAFEKTHQVVLVDLPGHGKSDKPPIQYTMDLFARAVDAALKAAGVEKAVLIGHSMGAPVIRQFYRLFPEKTLAIVAVDGSIIAAQGQAEGFVNFSRALEEQNDQTLQAAVIDGMFGQNAPQQLREYVRSVMLAAPRHVTVSAMKAMADPAVWNEDPIAVPVLLIMAHRDPPPPAEFVQRLHKTAPKIEEHTMTGVGHFLMMENPDGFNRLLQAFLGQHVSGL